MRSLEPGEDWGWCYIDELMIEPFSRALALQSKGRVNR
jgi:hypothetical protein